MKDDDAIYGAAIRRLTLEGKCTFPMPSNDKNEKVFFRYEMPSSDMAFAATLLTEVAIHEVGDGDGENGGRGPLKNCYGDIWNSLYLDGCYSYANLSFVISINEISPEEADLYHANTDAV